MMLAHTYPSYYPGGIHQRQQLRQQKQRPSQQQPQQPQQQFQNFQQSDFAASHQPAFSTTRDNIPTAAAAIAATQRQSHTSPVTSNTQVLDSMPSDSWMLHGQYTPRQAQRFGHQRNSSLSSVGSNTPVSPYNPNTTNPRIAVTDVVGDGLHDITGVADGNYTFDMTKPIALSDTFYANGLGSFNGHSNGGMDAHTMMGDMGTPEGLPALIGTPHRRQAGLAPSSDMTASSHVTKSRPMSVASSVGGDSPATPSFQEQEDEHRRTNNGEADSPVLFLFDPTIEFSDEYSHPHLGDIAFTSGANMPKLNRTMTDAYTDELYNPNFAMTSTSPPSQHSQPAPAPTRDLFSQRLHAANAQHLYAPQSPMLGDSRERSPFRQGSPYASALNDIPKAGTNRARLESAQQLRERRKAESDAKQLQQQQQQQSTPATISPKDAMLEFNEAEIDSSLPLFPPHEVNTYGSSQANGAGHMARLPTQQSASPFSSMSTTPVHSNFSFSMPSNMPHIQIPQEYPFVARQRSQQEQQQHQQPTPSTSTFSRVGSVDTCNAENDSGNDIYVRRPERTAADTGTYTCTYHGCTLRFETPALLQKHKREAHRQPNAVNHLRSQANIGSPESNMANSQAGPHRCDRINPSTGKPCNAIFSRPYDLTRHEDTIHNAGKQKVRCDLCTEEKTFSRADALTRHYRVCHPDADIPGKHRKRARTMGM